MSIKMKIKLMILSLYLPLNVVAAINTQQSILQMNVENDGIYRVNNNDLVNMGISLIGIDIENIGVSVKGTAIPITIFSNGSSFDSDSYIEFIGKSGEDLYRKGNIYNLILEDNLTIIKSDIVAQEHSLRVSHYIQTNELKENNAYSFGSPSDDPWYRNRILAIGAEETEILDFNIDNMASMGQLEITMDVWGGTDYPETLDHHVIYELNGSNLDDFRFDGVVTQIKSYVKPLSDITNGNNQLLVRVPNDTNTPADVVHVESLKISYPRNFVLMEKQIKFQIDSGNQENNDDIVFYNSFEDVLINKSKNSGVNNYRISNANNEIYRVLQQNPDGTVTELNTLSSGVCNSYVDTNCFINFSLTNNNGFVYVAAKSELLKPEFSLPVILSDINVTNSIDYLIISHPDFINDTLDEFVTSKEINYTVKVVDVEQIYAQYDYGNISSDGIAEYIKYMATNSDVKNVLLVGGDTYDYKNYLGIGSISFIPTIYRSTDDLISFAPVDAKYADINNDDIPDINIGRLPVRTEIELANITAKILSYENKTYNMTAIFAADKYDNSNGYSFKDDAISLINSLPPNWQNNITLSNKAFLDDDGIDIAKSKIVNNINQGVALTSFIGHSGPKDWSFSRMFSTGDANSLINSESPTIVTQWGCWNTYFVSPTEDTLAHAFMLNENGGAASVLGASTLTKASHEKALAQIVLTLLTQDGMTLGDAVRNAKASYAVINPAALDVILGWTILGDPTIKL